MCLPGSGLDPVGPFLTLKQASPWAWRRSRTSHRTSSWPGLQLRDIAAALIPSWIETHEGSRTIDARGEAGPYGPYDVPFPPLFVSSLTARVSGRANAEGVHVRADPVQLEVYQTDEGTPRPLPDHQERAHTEEREEALLFTWPSPLFSARPLTSSTLCALELPTKLQSSYVIMTHEATAKATAVAETEAAKAAAHHNVDNAASEGIM